MNLAEKILYLRKKQGMSQEELAEKMNVSRQSISRWEVGTANPDAINVLQLSKIFGVTSDYLLNDDYESDQDIPCVKEVKISLDEKNSKYSRALLIAAFAYLIAAMCFLFVAIDNLDVVFIILDIACSVLAGVYLHRYLKEKNEKNT